LQQSRRRGNRTDRAVPSGAHGTEFLTGVDGAANAADEVEGLLDITQSRGSPDTRRQCVA